MNGKAMLCVGVVLLARYAAATTVTLQEGTDGYAGFEDAYIELDSATPAGSVDYLLLHWASG